MFFFCIIFFFFIDCFSDEDEILIAFGEEIGKLVPYCGGKNWAYVLLTPLEQLCILEDNDVRKAVCFFISLFLSFKKYLKCVLQAINSIANIFNFLPQNIIESNGYDLVKRLCMGDWMTKRCSACALIPAIYKRCNPKQKEELVTLYSNLCKDDASMVRRNAAIVMKV